MTVDMEHSHTDIQTAALMFGAIADAGCVPIARVPTGRHDYIKMVLDCGAMGIVAPMVMTPEEARTIVAACKFPPVGNRSLGGSLHALNYGCSAEEYFAKANDEILVIAMIETQAGIDNIDEILAVPGISGIYIGPSDMGLALGLIPTLDREEPIILDIYKKLIASCKKHGKFAGLHNATAAYAARMVGMGFQLCTIANDSGLMARAARDAVGAFRKEAGDSAA